MIPEQSQLYSISHIFSYFFIQLKVPHLLNPHIEILCCDPMHRNVVRRKILPPANFFWIFSSFFDPPLSSCVVRCLSSMFSTCYLTFLHQIWLLSLVYTAHYNKFLIISDHECGCGSSLNSTFASTCVIYVATFVNEYEHPHINKQSVINLFSYLLNYLEF
jgi:hypothetical protein